MSAEKEININLKLGIENDSQQKTVSDQGTEKPKSKEIYLTEEARNSNSMFIGIAGSGKSQYIIPLIFKQDLAKRDRGITVICNQKDAAYTLYTMAKEAKRKVILLKPSTNFAVLNELLKKPTWNYNYINDNIINYKKAIKEKNIVIIDMEYDYYRNDAVRATAMLLLQLQTDMCITGETNKTKHYVYIDDCQHYLPFIEMLIECGGNYNMASFLFFQGRNQFKCDGVDYTGFIDNNVRNTFLMNNMNYEDVKYYGEKLCPLNSDIKTNIYNFLRLPYGCFIYDIQGENYQRNIGTGRLLGISEAEMTKIRRKAIKHRKSLTKIKDRDYNASLLQPEIKHLYKYNNLDSINIDNKAEKEALAVKTEVANTEENGREEDKVVNVVEKDVKSDDPQTVAVKNDVSHEITEFNKAEMKNKKEDNSALNGLKILAIDDSDMESDFDTSEAVIDDLDSVMDQLEDLPYSFGSNEAEEDIMMDEKIEITEHAKVIANSHINHILFPTIVSSRQKQYNSQLKKIK